jgi:hypothetical protein
VPPHTGVGELQVSVELPEHFAAEPASQVQTPASVQFPVQVVEATDP